MKKIGEQILKQEKKSPPRFCCKECAKKYASNQLQRNRTKPAVCTKCGKIENIPISASEKIFVCDRCKTAPQKSSSKILNEDLLKFINSRFYIQKSSNLSKLGFNFSNPNIEDEFNKFKNKLYDLYFVQNLSSLEISKIFDVNLNSGLLKRIFKVLGFQMRTLREATSLAIKEGRLKTNTINMIVKHPSNHPFYDQGYLIIKEGTINAQRVFYRSSYEKAFLKKLENLNVAFECNTFNINYFDTQENKLRRGFPDFYFPTYSTCIEIKGEYFYDEINLNDRFQSLKEKDINLFVLFYNKKQKQFFLKKEFITNDFSETSFKEEVLNFLLE